MKKYLGLVVGLALICPVVAGAMEFRSGQTVGLNDVIKDNVYVSGGTVNVAGTIEGDLYVCGGTINVMGNVTGDVVVGGGTVIITGKIGDDLRVGGGNVIVGGSVGGELMVGAGQVDVLAGANIARGAYIATGKVIMDGSVGKDLIIRGSEVMLGDNAKVGGKFEYYAPKEATIASGAKISGATNFHQQVVKKPVRIEKFPFFAFLTFWWLVGVAGAIILACFLFYLWSKDSKEMITKAFASPGRELIRGFVLLFIIPIAAVICSITLIGLPLGLAVGFAYAVLTMLAAAMSGLLGAALLAKFMFKKKETEISWWLIALALLFLALIKLIPIVGWFLVFLVYLVALGVLGNKLYSKFAPEK